MFPDHSHLYLERCDPCRNMARFYRLSISSDLFGQIILIREWGRIGSSGRIRTEVFASRQAALRACLGLLRRKRLRGYRPRART